MLDNNKVYDLIIIGAGPAGITAGIYASRYKLDTLVIGKNRGGQIAEAGEVENWPGEKLISGPALADKFIDHLLSFGISLEPLDVKRVEKDGENFRVSCEKKEFVGKSLILATGLARRKLGVPGEQEFAGKGVSYCFTCDAPFFRDKIVAVIGGSDSAVSGALFLSEYAKKVYIIYRQEELRAMPVAVEAAKANPKIEIIYKANVKKINGGDVVTDADLDTGQNLKLDGIFIEIGSEPAKDLVVSFGVVTDEKGEILVNNKMQTNIKGVCAAGDITSSGSYLRQAVTAAGEGAKAALTCFKYIKQGVWD